MVPQLIVRGLGFGIDSHPSGPARSALAGCQPRVIGGVVIDGVFRRSFHNLMLFIRI